MQCVVERSAPATGELKQCSEPGARRRRPPAEDKVFGAQTTEEIIEVMQADDEAAERVRILETMTPACRKKLEYIQTWFRRDVTHTLRSRYELGLQVRELYEDERKNAGKVYGRKAIERICKLLPWDDGVIRLALRFVKAFTEADLEDLCAQTLPTGEPLTWSHIRALLQIEDAKRRRTLLDRTIKEGWTCTELAHQIVNGDVQRPKDARGRPPRSPKDFDGAVAQQQESAEKWDRLYSKVWAKPDRSLTSQAAKLSDDEVTEARLREARVLAQQLRQVAEHVVKQAEEAERVVHDFERILGKRKPAKKSSN